MADAVVLQGAPSVASQIADSVSSFLQARKQAQLQQATANYAKLRDNVADKHFNEQLQLNKNADARAQRGADDTHALQSERVTQADANIDATHAATALATQSHEQKAQLFKYEKEYAQLRNKLASGQVVSLADRHRMAGLDIYIKQLEAQNKKTELALKNALDSAKVQHEQASTGHEEAETYREYHPLAPAAEREQTDANNLYNGLPPVGKAFVDMLFNTNNPATRGQGLAALQNSKMPANVKQQVQQYMESRNPTVASAFVTPQQQFSDAERTKNDTDRDNKYASAQFLRHAEDSMHAIGKGRQFDALPVQQKGVLAGFVYNTGDYNAATAAMKAVAQGKAVNPEPESFSDQDIQDTLDSLGIQWQTP